MHTLDNIQVHFVYITSTFLVCFRLFWIRFWLINLGYFAYAIRPHHFNISVMIQVRKNRLCLKSSLDTFSWIHTCTSVLFPVGFQPHEIKGREDVQVWCSEPQVSIFPDPTEQKRMCPHCDLTKSTSIFSFQLTKEQNEVPRRKRIHLACYYFSFSRP